MEENESVFEKGNRGFTIFALVIVIIAILIFWHPWITESRANQSFEEYYGSTISSLFKVRLTEWEPFGHKFEVRSSAGNLLVGRGLVNLWGQVVSFEYIWEGNSCC